SSCRLAAAIIGNNNGVAHNHNDVGSYIVVVDDRALIEDPGSEVYTARTFSPRRYESNVLNSFGHSVPLVAGKMQEEGAQAKAITLRTDFADAQDTLVFDIRSAYAMPQLQTLTRTYVFSRRGKGSVAVTDEVGFSEPATFETALMTLSQWRQIDPRTLRIEDEGKTIDVQIDTGGVDFRIVSTEINEQVHTKRLPVRLGIQLEPAVRQAVVTFRITPGQ
ncbi:MAG: heparinase II/III family protein, partial [Phycisphaerales bacterium]